MGSEGQLADTSSFLIGTLCSALGKLGDEDLEVKLRVFGPV